ncbi:MAG: translocation/assembly module TamB domain-containing protein [Vicinamibacterales bacterium]
MALTDPPRLDFTVQADDVEVESVLAAVNRSDIPVAGSASLWGTVTGTTERPRGGVNLWASNLVAYQEPLGELTVNASLENQRVTVDTLELTKPQDDSTAHVSGTGSYVLDRHTYTVALESTDLRLEHAVLPGGTPIRGRVQLNVDGSGSIEQPVGTADARMSEVTWGLRELGDFTVRTRVEGTQALVDARSDRFNVTANAQIGVSTPYPSTVSATVDGLDLSTLPVQMPVPLTGTLHARMDGSADLADVAAGTANVVINAFEGSLNSQPMAVPEDAYLTYADQRLRIDSMRVTAGDSTLAVSGELPLEASGTPGTVSVDAQLDLWSLPAYMPGTAELSTYGRATLSGDISGTLRAMDPDLTLTVENGMVQTWSMTAAVHDITLMSRVADGIAVIDSLSATFGDIGVMTATARVPLDVVPAPVALPHPGGPISAELHASDINPAMIPGAPAALHGSLAVDASLAADEPSLGALSGTVEMPTVDVAVGDLAFAAAQPVRLAIANGLARIEQFSLSGSVGHLDVSGSTGLTGDGLNVDVDSQMNLAVFSAFAPTIRSEGDLVANFTARGSARAPNLQGTVSIADAVIAIDEPQIAAEHLAVKLSLDGPRATLTQLSGQLNGGDLSGAGTIVLGGDLPDINLQLSAADVALSTPLDMRSVSETHLQVRSEKDAIAVDGTITIREAGLTGDINFDTGLLAAINARRTLDLTEQRNQLLDRMRFNVKVETEQPLVIDNNIAKAEVTSDLRVLGTPYEVGLSGRLDLAEGSVITLTEHQYEVERGAITFVGERRIQPVFDLQLTTTASNYNITLAVSGQPGKTDTTLTSIPSLPEPDIMALLVTGRTLDEMRGEEFTVAREQVMSYLAGRLGSQLGQGIERATGLSEVRIEPNLIANEADPTARLTIGQDLAQNLKLVYSTNLSDSSDEIWVLTYDATRRFRTRAVRQSDGSYRSDFRHDVRFGGVPEPRRQKRQRPPVLAVALPDDAPMTRNELARAVRVKVGDPFDFLKLRDGIERINRALLDKSYLQSRVSSQREATAEGVRISISIVPGPVVEMAFQGVMPSSRVRRALRQQWQRGVVDSQRLDDAIESLREWLIDDRYMNPTIHGRIEGDTAGRRRIVFEIERGSRFTELTIVFNGAQGVSADELVRIVHDQKQEQKLYTDQAVVVALLERYYHEQGYLTADIHTPRYEYQGREARVVMDVIEGPRYTTRSVIAQGNTVFPSDRLVSDIPLVAGDVYRPAVAERSLDRLRDLYWRRGYNDVVCDYVLTLDRRNGQVDVAFSIAEGAQVVVSNVRVAGNEQTNDSLIRGQLEVTAGQPLDLAALAQSRKNLYDTGAYSLVEVEQRAADTARGSEPAPATPTATKPVDLDVTVREVQPYQLEYGVSYDTERGLGGILDVSDHNTLGAAREIGLRSRYDAQLHEARVYFTQPSLLTWKVKTAVSAYTSREEDPATSLSGAFTIDRIGASISQERELRNHYVWNYGFRYERAHTFDVSGARDERVKVSPLTSTFTRETRDDLLDARKGSFTSHSFSYAPSWLGTDAPYIKYFGQYFRYVALQPERRKPLTNEILKPRLVYAFGVRLGLARGLGSAVPSSERFFAGGSTSLRGFEQNAVGPLAAGNVAAGGAASLIINNELRFPLISIFDGVAFADTGNVYARAADFSLTDLRQTIGGGLRVRTKWFLLRGDYGFVLSPRPGESRSRAYFSIGQAF